MTISSSKQNSSDLLLADLIDQAMKSQQAGEPFDLEAHAARHPEYAEQLRQLLPALELLADLSEAGGRRGPSNGDLADRSAAESGSRPLRGNVGEYQVLREVGRGGMGVVYEAEQTSLGRRVALKIFPFAAALDPRRLQRFQNEARAAASLKHPNIVGVYSVGCDRGVHYYAMEYVEGQTLAEVISQGSGVRDQGSGVATSVATPSPAASGEGPEERVTGRRGDKVTTATARDSPPHPVTPSPPHPPTDTSPLAALSTEGSNRIPQFFRTVARLGIQAAEALEHAHQMGVVHRDIKPSNLMVESRLPSPAAGRGAGGEGAGAQAPHLWITDFGLAMTQTDTNLTMTGDLLGTLRYMSPEQVQARHGMLDHRTDVYSLGLTLYELLTLQPAFPGDDRQKLLRQVAEDDPRPPLQLNPSIPKDLETIVLKATAKEPEDRYATAQELAEDLGRFLEDKPVEARRPTLPQRAAKWSRRHRPLVWSAVLLLVVATIGLTVGIVAVSRESARAEKNLRLALEAVDEIYLQFADDTFLELAADGDAPQEPIPPETEKFLKKALNFYEQFAEANRDSSSVRHETVKAYRRVAKIRSRLGMDYEAQLAFRQGIEIGKELVSDYPDVEDYRSSLALLHYYNGNICVRVKKDLFGSIAQYNEAIRLDPKYANAYRNRGIVYRRVGNFDGSIADSTQAIRLDPNDFMASVSRGHTHLEKGDFDEAIADFSRAIRLDPKEHVGYHGRGLAYTKKGDFDEAIADYTDGIRFQPNDHLLYSNRGIAYLHKGELDKAIADCEQAIRLAPEYAITYCNRGVAYEDKGELDKAIADYDQAIRLGPAWVIAYCNRGNAYDDKGELDKAIAEFTKGIQLGPKHSLGYHCRGSVYRKMGELDKAIDDLTKAIQLDPNSASSYTRRAETRAELGQIEDALGDVAKALEIEVRIPRDKRPLAWFLATCEEPRLRRPDRAVELAKEVVKVAPRYLSSWTTLGAAEYRAGNPKAALNALQKSSELKYYRVASTQFFAAMAHWQLDQKQQARRAFDKAIEWTDKNRPWDEELRRFRAEAAEVLEIENGQPE